MLTAWKNGTQVKCSPIYDTGRIGQVVILDNVDYGRNPNLDKHPLARYPQPCICTIAGKKSVDHGYVYVLKDTDGKNIVLPSSHSDTTGWYLYDATSWLEWQKAKIEEEKERSDHEIRQLRIEKELLEKILVAQGFRVITQEQAKKLGIPNS